MTHSIDSADDLRRFLRDLEDGLSVRMLIAPAAPPAFGDFPRVLGCLRSLGVKAFYPVLPYADITVWAYYRIFRNNPDTKLIASACVGTNGYFKEHNKEYAGYLCSVFSPLLCAARYLKTYRGLKEPLAFLSPCLLKKNEFITKNNEELVRYNITIKALNAWLAAEEIDIQRYEPCPPETDPNGGGLTVAAFGGIGAALAALLPGVRRHAEQGMGNVVSWLSQTRDFRDSRALIFEPYACRGGCANGPGAGNRGPRGERNFLKRREETDPEKIFELFSRYDETLKPEDFCCPGEDMRANPCPEDPKNPLSRGRKGGFPGIL